MEWGFLAIGFLNLVIYGALAFAFIVVAGRWWFGHWGPAKDKGSGANRSTS